MEIIQVYNIVNTATNEVLGKTDVLNENLSNIVDIGNAIFNANALDKYVNALVNHIGKIIFVNRLYRGSAPSVMMDGWEFGSVLEKVSTILPEAVENESWELVNNTSYDPNIFYKPTVEAKFFNKRVTFEVPMSFTEKQVKMSFSNATQLNAFISMLYTSVENSMTVKIDNLIMKTINNMSAETLRDDYNSNTTFNTSSGAKAINLLYLYNQTVDTPITADDCMSNADFIRFASYIIKLTADRMQKMSSLFNIGKQPRFTPKDELHIVLLSDFINSADVFLQSTTFHDELTKLPLAESVPYWQGSGTDYSFNSVSKIDVTTTSNNNVTTTGIIGVMFDRWALGVTNMDRRVTSNYNPKAEFYTNWYKYDAGYYNDFNENFVVFFVA